MIYVEKPLGMAPPEFLAAAQSELQELIPVFTNGANPKPRFKFRAYRNKELVKVLKELFQGKCAYCEARPDVTGYTEVEHYRPKKIYWWLAADWANLLPACGQCNRGKLSKFPLVDDLKQARAQGEEINEQPLLLNPCNPDPSRRPDKHLTFDTTDGVVRPVLEAGQASVIGEKSIAIFRLWRRELSDARKEWALIVRSAIEFSKKVVEDGGTAQQREIAYQSLKAVMEPSKPFRALTLEIFRANGIRTS